MVESINRLIRNRLLTSDEALRLPGTGSLRVLHKPAVRLSRKELRPPHREVVFSEEEAGLSIVEIMTGLGVDENAARSACEAWRKAAYSNGVLGIDGVGTISKGIFTPEPEFRMSLNPYGISPVEIKLRSNKTLYILTVFGCILLLCGAVYLFIGNRSHAPSAAFGPEPPTVSVETENIAVETAEPVAEESVAVQAAQEPAPSAEADIPTAAYTTRGTSYIVLGVFSTEENARRAATDARTRYTEADYRIYHYADRFLVTMFESTEPGECTAFQRSAAGIFPDLWIYTRR